MSKPKVFLILFKKKKLKKVPCRTRVSVDELLEDFILMQFVRGVGSNAKELFDSCGIFCFCFFVFFVFFFCFLFFSRRRRKYCK
jgi:hypothetical protein